jgi:hypothetical protein
MENDLANFQTSSANTNLLLNKDKCKTLQITRKRNKIDHTYKLQDSALQTTDCERDLGPPPVRPSQQIPRVYSTVHDQNQDHLCSSNSISYPRSFPPRIRIRASQVWAPQTIDLIKRTERIQRRASKYILNLPFFCDISYNHRLSTLNLLP